MNAHHYVTPDGTEFRIEIDRDDEAMSPRDADNVTIMVTSDGAMVSPDHGYVKDSEVPAIPLGEYVESRRSNGVDMRRIRKYAALFLPEVIAIAGLDVRQDWTPTLALTDDDESDGFIVITRKTWDMCMGADTEPTPELCRDIMTDEVDAYNRWAQGEYVSYSVFQRVEWTREDTGETRAEWELTESCGSIDDPDYALSEAIACLPDDAVSNDIEIAPYPYDNATLDCARVGSHHSEDRVEVYHGTPVPYRMCGFHASQVDAKFLARIAEGQ